MALTPTCRLPLRIETRLGEGCAEGVAIDVEKADAFGGQIRAQRLAERCDVCALFGAGGIQFARDDRLHVGGHGGPAAAIGESYVAVPDMTRHRDGFLHLVKAGGIDDRERVFLALDDLGLERGIEFVEVDRGRTGI
jgi:hypothetical protein